MTINYRVRAGGSLIFYNKGYGYSSGTESRYKGERGQGGEDGDGYKIENSYGDGNKDGSGLKFRWNIVEEGIKRGQNN